ncbi:MAG: hypothetical protein ABL888_10805, partial [Pirellulaceae bacterium]
MKSIICLARLLALSACTLAVGCAVFDNGTTNTLSNPKVELGFSKSTGSSLNEEIVEVNKANQPKDQFDSSSGQETVAQLDSANPDRNVQGVGSAVIRGLSGVDDGASIKPSPGLDEPIEVANLDVDASRYSADRIGNVEPVQNGQTIQASLVSAAIAEPTTIPQPPVFAKANGSLSVSDGAGANKMSWSINQKEPRRIFARGAEITLNFAGLNIGQNLLIKVGDKFVTGSTNVSFDTFQNAVHQLTTAEPFVVQPNKLAPGDSSRIIVWISQTAFSGEPLAATALWEFDVVAAGTPGDPFAPSITKVSNAEFGNAEAFADTTYSFFGDKPYIRLEGQNGMRGELSFVLVDSNGIETKAKIEDLNIQNIDPAQKTWQADFKLSERLDPDDSQARLFVLREKGDKHNYSQTPLTFITEPFGKPPALGDVTVMVDGRSRDSIEGIFPVNKTEIALAGTATQTISDDFVLVAYPNNSREIVGAKRGTGSTAWQIPLTNLKPGRQEFRIDVRQGDKSVLETPLGPVTVFVNTEKPKVASVDPSNFGTAPGVTALTIKFDPANPIVTTKVVDTDHPEPGVAPVDNEAYYSIVGSNGTGVFTAGQKPTKAATAKFDPKRNAVTLTFPAFPADIYQLRIDGSKIVDIYGNSLDEYTKSLSGDGTGLGARFKPEDSPTVRPGISGKTGEYVQYPEFAKRPDVPDGFNPNDKVETRVVRLYYYRDAHRIAQIVNRKVQSYNRQAVDTNRQLADKARNQASQLSIQRQNAERNAIIQATNTRQKERELQQAENSLDGSIQQLSNYRIDKPEADPANDPTIRQLES